MIPISVMIPIYNGESFLKEAIDSVLNQTFSDFEVLALDDGSTDSSAAIVQSYTDPRMKYIQCTHDFIDTLNKGLELADGKYIALIDHDDIMLRDRLEIQYNFMESNPDIAACGGYMKSFGLRNGEIKAPLTHPDIIQAMLLYSPIQNPTGFIRRQFLSDHNIQYEHGYFWSADYKLWSEIAKAGQLATIPQVLTLYRTHEEQTSHQYLAQRQEGRQNVQFEMINYFLSHLKENNELAHAIQTDVISTISDIGELGFFSDDVFFAFMYDMIRGLMRKGIIEIPGT